MFRDLKEYQDITKIYTEKVSKSKNLDEQIVGSMPVKTAGSGNVRGSGVQKKLNPGKVTPQSQIRKIDPKQFDNRSAAVTTNTPSGGSLKAGSFGISQAGKQQAAANKAEFKAKADAVKASSTTESKPVVSTTTKQGKPRTKAQMMAANRIASGKTIADVKAANTKSMQDRARAKNTEFQAAKKAGTLKQFRKDNPKVSGADRAKLMAKARIEAQKKAAEKPIEKKDTPIQKKDTPIQKKDTPIEKKQETTNTNTSDKKVTSFKDTSMGKGEKVKVTPFKDTSMGKKDGDKKIDTSFDTTKIIKNAIDKKNIKKKEAFENNPRVKNFRKKVDDLKTTAKYGSTATIQTQDGKEFKPGDPGYEAELKKARNVVQKSMQRNSYEPDMDAYDMVLEYLLSTEQVATIEEANYVMMQLDEENIQEIVGSVAKLVMKTPLVKLVPAAIGTGIATKMIASKMGKKSVQPVAPPEVKKPKKDIQVGDGIKPQQPGESLMDYYKRRRNSLETQDKKLGSGDY